MIQCLFYRHNRGSIKEAIPPARLPAYGLTFLFDGELRYHLDGKELRLRAGDAIFLPKGCLRARNEILVSDHISFQFDAEKSPDLPVFLPSCMTPTLRRLLAVFDEIAAGCDGPEDERFGPFLEFLITQLRIQIREEEEDPLVKSVKNYLLERLDQRITLADVGMAVSFSPSHCQAVFRAKTGRSIIDTLLDMRMKKAKELISSGEFTLPDVAEKVGFDDYNYFSRQFRARCGTSPSCYRRLLS